MPRLSVTFAIAAFLCAASVAHAQEYRVIIRKAEQLEKNKAVREIEQPYRALSAANVIYAKCDKDYGLTQAHKDWLKAKFEETSKTYMKAFDDAYVAYVGVPSTMELRKDYARYITERQKGVVTSMATLIHQKGCADGRLKPIMTYVEQMRVAEAKLKEIEKAKAAKAAEQKANDAALAKTLSGGVLPANASPVAQTAPLPVTAP
jgi:hypothetical protein